MTDLYRYKDESYSLSVREASTTRLRQLMFESLSLHLKCFRALSPAPLVIASVPSTSMSRLGPHPFETITHMFRKNYDHTDVTYVGAGGDRNERRKLRPHHFRVVAEEVVGKHVLLLDDSWVSGGHAQSVAAALRIEGAARVDVIVLGRVLDPGFTNTKLYLEENSFGPFDPAICPITGIAHG